MKDIEPKDLINLATNVQRKASALSISLAVVIFVSIASIAAAFYANRGTIETIFSNARELDNMRALHEECHKHLDDISSRLDRAEAKISELQVRKVASN